MSTIRSIIVDDEINGRENLSGALAKHFPEISIVAEASSAIEAIQKIEEYQPALVFLDIEMPGGSGFEVLNHFNQPQFKVIFVTAYDQYAIRAIKFSALDYILKPIDLLELKTAIKRFQIDQEEFDTRIRVFKDNREAQTSEKKIAISLSDKIDFIPVKNIISCKGEGGYTRVYLHGQEILSSKPLIDYEDLLKDAGFLRTHKTHLVNLFQIQSFVKKEGGYLLMNDDSIVPIARRKKEEVLAFLKNRMLV